jgi:F-type H+-transporting ATPase subunit b
MASLNLVPDPEVLVVQAGVFLVALGVVKKLYVEPYLKVRERREAATIGSKDEAAQTLVECAKISNQIEARLAAAAVEAKAARETVKVAALERQAAIMATATAEANATVAAVEQQIQRELAGELAKIPAVVSQLTDEVYKLALA